MRRNATAAISVVLIGSALVGDRAHRSRRASAAALGLILGAMLVVAGAVRLYLRDAVRCAPPRCPGLVRSLTQESLAAVAYGEIASSIYFALGDRRAVRARPDAVGAARRRDAVPARRALLRGGHRGDPRDRRRGDVRPPRVQRPRRLPDRLGAVPRLPDRDRALRAVRAALLRARGRLGAAHPPPVGRRRRASSSSSRSPSCGSSAGRASTGSRSSSPSSRSSRRCC